jgi:copper oxidase (laccase) domain-containing protein
VVGGCTHHDDRFHSYRNDGTSHRQFGVAWVPAG